MVCGAGFSSHPIRAQAVFGLNFKFLL
jgi:hypothetical protein